LIGVQLHYLIRRNPRAQVTVNRRKIRTNSSGYEILFNCGLYLSTLFLW
jgi:hypothetical protein